MIIATKKNKNSEANFTGNIGVFGDNAVLLIAKGEQNKSALKVIQDVIRYSKTHELDFMTQEEREEFADNIIPVSEAAAEFENTVDEYDDYNEDMQTDFFESDCHPTTNDTQGISEELNKVDENSQATQQIALQAVKLATMAKEDADRSKDYVQRLHEEMRHLGETINTNVKQAKIDINDLTLGMSQFDIRLKNLKWRITKKIDMLTQEQKKANITAVLAATFSAGAILLHFIS